MGALTMNFLDGKIERRGSELGAVSGAVDLIPAPTIEGYPEGESASVGIRPSRSWPSQALVISLVPVEPAGVDGLGDACSLPDRLR